MVVAKKLAQLIGTVLLVTLFASFLIELLPGNLDEVLVPVPIEKPEREQLREDLGLNRPFIARYADWLGGFATGDMGSYYTTSSSSPVGERLWPAMGKSLQLMFYAQVLALLFAIPLGVLTAYRNGSVFDRLTNTTMFAFLAIPTFALGFILQYYLAVQWPVFLAGRYVGLGENPVDHVRSMFLPTITLAVGQIAIYMRLLRSDMISTLQQDFITMAKAKGLRNRRILFRHALRPSSLTLLTVAGLNVGTLIGGALIVEVVFTIPGMGYLLAEAIATRQLVAFQSIVAVIAILYVVINFGVDLLYSVLDPRIRHATDS